MFQFDAADRMFNSVQEAWQSVLTNAADLKVWRSIAAVAITESHLTHTAQSHTPPQQELIPDFYTPENRGAFLLKPSRLKLGVRQDGRPV